FSSSLGSNRRDDFVRPQPYSGIQRHLVPLGETPDIIARLRKLEYRLGNVRNLSTVGPQMARITREKRGHPRHPRLNNFPLQLPQGRRNRQPRGTNCRKQPADKSDGQSIKEAGWKKPRRGTKREGYLTESLKVHRRRLISVESEICSRSTYQAADGAEHDRFCEDRQQHRRSIETNGPQRRDFTRSCCYGGINTRDGAG